MPQPEKSWKLLIVPYGIETKWRMPQPEKSWKLLIVPYGIETFLKARAGYSAGLLIVPYGIETHLFYFLHNRKFSFNRTLWN